MFKFLFIPKNNGMTRLIMVLILGMSGQCLSAQNTISLSEFLGASSSRAQQAIAAEQNALANQDNELPFIEDWEFRTETNDFKLDKQEYALRLKPNLPKHRKANNQYYNLLYNLYDAKSKIAQKESLVERYELAISLAQAQLRMQQLEELSPILQDQLTVAKKLMASDKSDIKALISVENDLDDLSFDKIKVADRIEILQSRIAQISNGSTLTLRTDNWLNTTQIADSLTITTLTSTTDSRAIEQEINLADQEYATELAKINNPIDFLQVRFRGKDESELRELFSVGLGIRIPTKGEGQLKLNEIEIEKLEKQNELATLLHRRENQIALIAKEIELSIMEVEELSSKSKDSQAQKLYDYYQKEGVADIMDFLELKAALLKRQHDIQALRLEVFERYVRWLELTDKIMVGGNLLEP